MSEGVDNSVGTLSEKLRQAASQGQFDTVRELVKAGAQFSSDQEGRTALHYAALNGHVDICKFLIQQGCDIDEKDVLGYTPLHRAASKGHVEAIEFLLSTKCNVDSQDEHGNGAIHESAWNGFSQTLEILIKHHCNVILTNKSGFTALHLASQNGHNQSARVLLYGGCNADLKNNYGDTALHTAARYGHAGVTRILISARCRLNEQNKNGDTALHISSALKRKKIAKLLVEAGVNVDIVNKQEETAIDVARRKDHPEIIMTITSMLKTKAQIHSPQKVVNFSEVAVDMEGPVVVPDQELPVKTEKSEKGSKFFSFLKKKKKEKDKPAPSGSQVHPTQSHQTVQGFFSKYTPKAGQQYYRDLAGNIKQGPVGYTPICQCMPALHQLEQKVDKDKEHIYEHIDASHQILKTRMEMLDRKTTQQISAMDRWSRERFDEEERNCYSRIDQRMRDQEHYMAHRNHQGMDVDDWFEARLSEYGHCLDHHHDDSALPSNNIFTDIHHTENGRLFRSRSDETLSQSDNHSGKFRKRQFYESRQQAMQQIRAWQLPSYSKERGSRNPNPVLGRRDNYGIHNPQTLNRNTNQQSGRQNLVSPTSQQNTRSSSRPDFISPSTVSTNRSPYMSHDPIYGSQYSGYNQGAVPKRLPTSQTWHGAHELQTSVQRESVLPKPDLRASGHRESSPLIHSTPKSRESSPYDYQHLPNRKIVKGTTEPENLTQKQSESRNIYSDSKHIHSENRTPQNENRLVQSESRNIYGDRKQQYHSPRTPVQQDNKKYANDHFDRQHEARRSNMETRNLHSEHRNSDTRRSFPERGSTNTNTGTNMTSNSSSTGQGPLNASSTVKSSRPTFTTFGYPERENSYNTQAALNPAIKNSGIPSGESNIVNSASVKNMPQSESVYAYHNDSSRNSRNTAANNPVAQYSVQNGGINERSRTRTNQDNTKISAINSVNNVNRDDMYISSNQNMQMSRQRSRSTDGILLEEELLSAHQMKLRMQEQSVQRSITPNSSRSVQGQSCNVQSESVKRSTPLYGDSRMYSDGVSRTYSNDKSERNLQNSQYYSASQGNVSRNVPFTKYSSVKQSSSGQVYGSSRDVPSNRDRPHWVNDSSYRDNPYGSVQNFSHRSTSRQSNAYNHRNSDVQGVGSSVYSSHTSVQKLNGEKESSLDPTHPVHDQSLSPRDTDRNLQSTPIQDKSREDNSSNPDSGYSSKIFGHNTNSGNVPSTSDTPSSSFSTEPTDHNITLSSNNSPHPQVNHSDYAQIKSVRDQYQKDLSNHVQQWYQRKLKDAAKNLNEEPYGQHTGYHSQSNNVQNPNYSGYEYVQPSRQMPYHANQMYSTYQQVPNYIRGSDV